jgi:hypothetical protein
MGWMIGVLGFDSWQGLGIFLFTTTSRMTLRLTQPSIQGVPGAFSLGVKWPGHDADHSLVLRSKNECSYTSTPQYALMAWCLVKKTKAQGQLYLLTFTSTPKAVTQNFFHYRYNGYTAIIITQASFVKR